MPVISMTMGPTPTDQKTQLVEKLTETAVEITGIPAQFFTITINELSFDNLGVGGQTVTELHKNQP